MSNPRERKALRAIIKLIRRFDRLCARVEHTDTGTAWEIFEDIEDMAKAALVRRKRRRS